MTRPLRLFCLSLAALALAAGAPAPKPASVSARIAAAGRLKCATIAEPQDWNKVDLHGRMLGLDAALCNAVGVALLGRAGLVDIQPYDQEDDGIRAVQSGEMDLVVGVTPAVALAAQGHIQFSQPYFLDGLGFLAHKDEGVHSLADISGHKICFIDGTDNERILLDTLNARGIHPLPFDFQEEGEMNAAMMDRHCQVTGALVSKLAEARATFRNGSDWIILPELLQLVPLTIGSDNRDPRLSAIINATLSALLEAEDLGVTHASVLTLGHSENPRMQRLTGEDFVTAQGLGLPHDWVRRVIAVTGNYGEIFDLAVGAHARFRLDRGPNALWSHGGKLAPLPLQ